MRVDASGWKTRLTTDLVLAYTSARKWSGSTLAEAARTRAISDPARTIAIEGERTLSYAQLLSQARRLHTAMHDLGLQAGDVVSFQLPNWLETLVINLAACIGGYICNPIVPIYRDAEVEFILRDAKSKLLFVPETFRSIDYEPMTARLRARLTDLRSVVTVRGSNFHSDSFERFSGASDSSAEAAGEYPDPNTVKLLLYTSGTTGKPKGVLHSHNTLSSELAAVASFWKLSESDVILMPSPVTHITGYLYALEASAFIGAKIILMDRWDADEAVRSIMNHEVTFCVGATPFLVELTAAAHRAGLCLPSLKRFVTGGAPVPPDAIRRANAQFKNCLAFRVYGSSEVPTVSLGVDEVSDIERGATTEGRIVNNRVRICDPVTGVALGIGEEGEITVCGPEVMLGYTDWDQTLAAFDAEGYFHTGDLGKIDDEGYLTITGRQKDLIIRGGENISPKEIEDFLHRHPGIREAAVIAIPNARLGEGVCACIIPVSGAEITREAIARFLDSQRIAKQKWPERVELMSEFPRTAAGKVRKNLLRETLAAIIASEGTTR